MIACNDIKKCEEIIRSLKDIFKSKTPSIKLLCSRYKNKNLFYYGEITSDGKLPARINFITAAYFTGFDLL